jgi:hypothetical protein
MRCVSKTAGDCQFDGPEPTLIAINGPAIAVEQVTAPPDITYEYRCALTEFRPTSCTYKGTSGLQSDTSVFTDLVSDYTPVVVTVTGGLEKLGSQPTSSTPVTTTSSTTESTSKESSATEVNTSLTATLSAKTTTVITDCKQYLEGNSILSSQPS